MTGLTPLGPMIVAVMWLQTAIALIFTVLRHYTRRHILASENWDDYLIYISMLLFILYTVFETIACTIGLGTHYTNLSTEAFATSNKYEIIGQAMNILAIATSKSSVAYFLLRIVVKKFHIWLLWFCIFSTCFVCFSCIIFMFTQCTPVEAIFNPTLGPVCHINFTANAIFSGSYTAAMDFTLAIIPWFVLKDVNIKRKERVTIVAGLSLGVIAGVCGIIRAVQLERLAAKADYTYETVPVLLWGSSELMVCMLCASIPTLRPLWKKIRGGNSSSDAYSYPLEDQPSYAHGTKNSHRLSQFNFSSKNPGNSTVTAYGGHKTDNSSEEIILHNPRGLGDIEGITRTTEVDISYGSDVERGRH